MTKPSAKPYDGIILGAGGAGLMCAAIAGQMGKRILALDHADKPGKKILISGGGRCNFTNLDVRPDRFLSKNPHFAKSALSQYTQHDFIDLVNRYNIAWHEKTLGQLFCDGSAKEIVQMLLDECAKGDVTVKLEHHILSVTKDNELFSIETDHGTFHSGKLVIATGGPSIPKMGATGFAYELARQFKLKVVEPRPALVPFTLGKEETLFSELSGVATETITKFNNTEFREASLFTHKGLSGPAMLQISSYWKPREAIAVDFLPNQESGWLIQVKENSPKQKVLTTLSQVLPERLAETLLHKLDQPNTLLAELKDKTLATIESALKYWQFHPNGTEGFAKAEVTIGGISTDELSSKTMETKKVPGLYFIGEAIDVTGWLGGYNFQWAWSSGYVAGKNI